MVSQQSVDRHIGINTLLVGTHDWPSFKLHHFHIFEQVNSMSGTYVFLDLSVFSHLLGSGPGLLMVQEQRLASSFDSARRLLRLSKDPNTKVSRVVEPQSPIQRRNALQLLCRQVKIRRGQVLSQPLLGVTLGDHNNVPLSRPAEQHLCWRLADPFRHLLDGRVLEQGTRIMRALHVELEEALRAKGAVSGDGNVVLLAHLDEVGLDEVRVVLDLVDGGLDLGVAQDVVEEHGVEVGNANGAEEALGVVLGDDKGLERLPGLLDGDWDELAYVLLGGVGPEAWKGVLACLWPLMDAEGRKSLRKLTMGTSTATLGRVLGRLGNG